MVRRRLAMAVGVVLGAVLGPVLAGPAGAQAVNPGVSAIVCPVLVAQRAQVNAQFAAIIAAFPQFAAVLGAQRDAALAVVNAQLLAFNCVASPTLSTQASGPADAGQPVTDSAVLAGGQNPTGSITFRLYGPDDATCAGTPAFTSTVPVAGNGSYPSGPYAATDPGTYRWVASYSGDGANNGATAPCNAADETVVVRTVPTLTTTASPAVTVGGQVRDTATLAGGAAPTGTITFRLFAPSDPSCAGPPVFTSSTPVTGNGDHVSDPFTTAATGTYRWVASYSGDPANAAVAGGCGDTGESVTSSAPGTRPGSTDPGTPSSTTGTGGTGTGPAVLGTVVEGGQAAAPTPAGAGGLPRTGAALAATLALGLLLVSAGGILVTRRRTGATG